MTNCPRCAGLVRDTKFCPHCGAPAAVVEGTGSEAQWAPDGHAPPPTMRPEGPAPQGPAPSAIKAAKRDGAGRSNRVAVLLGVVLGVGGLVAVGLVAFGGDSASGAGSPEEALESLVDAVNAEDALAIANAIAPDEVVGLADLSEGAIERLSESGVSGLSPGEGVNVQATLRDVRVQQRGDNAAMVEFSLDGDVDLEQLSGPLGEFFGPQYAFTTDDLRPQEEYDSGLDEILVVAVKLDGGWYVSPMLTVGEYIVRENELAPGDYDRIGEDDRGDGADTPIGAVEAFVDATGSLNTDSFAASLASAEARAVTVFERAIEDGLFELPPGVFTDITVEATDRGDGLVGVDTLRATITDPDGEWVSVVGLNDECIEIEETNYYDGDTYRDRACLSQVQRFYRPSDSQLVLTTVQEDGGYRVSLIRSLAALGTDVVDQVDIDAILHQGEVALYGDAATIEAPGTVEAIFDGDGALVYEFEAQPGEGYRVDVEGEYGDFEVYVLGDDGWEDVWSENVEVEAAARTRILVESEDRCGDFYCVPTGQGTVTVRVNSIERQAFEFPSEISGELEPGDAITLELTVAESQYIELEVTGTDIYAPDLRTIDGDYVDWPPPLPAGQYLLTVYNDGSSTSTYAVTSRVVDPYGFDGETSVVRSLSALVSGYTRGGSTFTISATPLDDQDIVVFVYNGDGDLACQADSNGYGGQEYCTLTATSDGEFSVEVYPNSGSSYGDVQIDYRLD